MTTYYVNSAAAGSNNGTSWANAFTTLQGFYSACSSGDTADILSTHAETHATTTQFYGPTNDAQPLFHYSCGNTHSPAQAGDLTVGASVTTTGNSNMQVSNNCYYYGITFNCGTGANNVNFQLGANNNATSYFDNCALKINATGATAFFIFQMGDGGYKYILNNTTLGFGNAGQIIEFAECDVVWQNTPSAITGTPPTVLWGATSNVASANWLVRGVDLSAITGTLVGGGAHCNVHFQFINCKLNAGVTICGTILYRYGTTVDVINSDSSGTNYRQERYTYTGKLLTSTAVTNGATDGTTPISWQVTTLATPLWYDPFPCFEIVQWVAAGTYAASYVNMTSATASLTNADAWVEADVMTSAASPISTTSTGKTATILTAGSTLTSGSAWTVPLGGSPNNYQLTIPSFTVALAGYVHFRVMIAKPSVTVYVDPKVVVA